MTCAIYARYSSARQNPLSVEDQIRKCVEFADSQGWQVPEQYIYSDAAISGAGADRPGFDRMLSEALAATHKFDVLLLDDTSRLSRSLADSLRTMERLNFAGVRVIAVSQGVDTANQQADVLMTVHGLVD